MNETHTPLANPQLDFETLKARLLAIAGVLDAHVLRSTVEYGAVLACYVAGGERNALEQAMAGFADAALVRVECLPLNGKGEVDENALRDLPAWTEALVAAAEERTLPPQSRLAYRTVGRERKRLHLADLLPAHPILAASAATADAGRADRDVAGAKESSRPSIHHAPPCIRPAGIPADLATALTLAAQTTGLGSVQVASNMSETQMTYAALFDEACRVLGGLQRSGIHSGDTLIVDATESRTLLPLFWACVLGGIVPVPFVLGGVSAGGAPLKRLRDSWHILGQPAIAAGAGVASSLAPLVEHDLSGMQILDAGNLPAGPAARPTPEGSPDGIAVILLTSGSTGMPKGVMLSQSNLLAMIAGVQDRVQFEKGGTSLNWMPLDHVGAVIFLSVQSIVLGLNQVHVDTATILASPARWLDLIHAHRVSLVWAPNFAFDLIMQAASRPGMADWDLSCLRMLVNAGESVSDSVVQAFTTQLEKYKLPTHVIWPSFGMTETASAFTWRQWTPATATFTNLGLPICGASQRVVDEAGQLVPEGTVGQLELKGPSLFAGYFGRPDLTAEVMRDGWFHSGDMAFMRDGELFVIGRNKEMIIVNGANFYSHEIEEAVARVDGVERLSVAAIGVRAPSAHTDQLAVFFHAPEAVDEHALKNIMQSIRMRLGKDVALTPDFFVSVTPDRLPRTGAGKIQRVELKRLLEAGAFDPEIKASACIMGGADTIPAWFFEPVWKRCNAKPAPAFRPISIAVFGADQFRFHALCEAWPEAGWVQIDAGAGCEKTGPRNWQMDVERADHFPALFASLAEHQATPDVILILDRHGASQAHAPLQTLLYLLQAQADLPNGPAELMVCSGAVQPGSGQAMLAAFLRSAALEIPGLRCRHIELPGENAALEARLIRDEIQSAALEAEVAHRSGQRYVKRFKAASPRTATHGHGFRPGGLYLMSGGLGGIGSLLARHLIVAYQVKLLLVGRTPAAQLDTQRAQVLAQLSQSGDVLYVRADAADPASLCEAVECARARWGQHLDGVLHLAGEGRQAALASETGTSIDRILHAKVAGTRTLYALVEGNPDASFIVIGSVAGALGGNQVAAYAAANAFQAAFVEQLAAGGRKHCRYLGFSSWRDIGMSRGTTSQVLLEAAGYIPIDPQSGLSSFDVALHCSSPVLLIGLDIKHPSHAFLQDGASAAVDELVMLRTGETDSTSAMPLNDAFGRPVQVPALTVDVMPLDVHGRIDRARLARIGAGMLQQIAAPRNEFDRYLIEIWCDVLSLPTCGIHDDFFALGGNSLRAAQVAARVREIFRLDIAMSDLLTSPTIAEFCDRVRVLEVKPGITEAIARRLFEIAKMPPSQKDVAGAIGSRS